MSGTQRETQEHGYLRWRLDAPLGTSRCPVIVADGRGSPSMHIVPDFDSVIVTTGGNRFNNKSYAVGEVRVRRLLLGIER